MPTPREPLRQCPLVPPKTLLQGTSTFTFLLSSLELGLKSLDVGISSSAAAAVDNIAGFYFRNVVQGVSGRGELEACRPAARITWMRW